MNLPRYYIIGTLPSLLLKQWLLLQLHPVVQRKQKMAHKLIRLHMRTFYWHTIYVSFSSVTSCTAPKGLNHPEFNDNSKHRISIFFLIQHPIPTYVPSSTAAQKKITRLTIRTMGKYLALPEHASVWVKRDQLDATCFIITLFSAQHVLDVNTSILRSLRLIRWVTSWVVPGSMCVGVTLQCGYGGVVCVCRLKPAYRYHTKAVKTTT